MRTRLLVPAVILALFVVAQQAVASAPRTVSIELPTDPSSQFPVAEYAAFGSVWVLVQGNTSALERVDPRTNRVTGSVSLGYGEPSGNDQFRGTVAAAGGSIWVPEYFRNTVLRIDPNTLTITRRIPVGRSPTSVIAVDHAIFVSDWHGEVVVKVDPRANRVVSRTRVGDPRDFNGGPFYLTFTAGHIWAELPDAERLVELDPATNRIVGRHRDAAAYNCGRLDPAPGAIWIDDSDCSNNFSRFDLSTGRITKTVTIPFATCLAGMTVFAGYLWTAEATRQPSGDCTAGELVRRDLQTGAVLGHIDIGVFGLEVFGMRHSLWTNDLTSNDHVVRVTPGASS